MKRATNRSPGNILFINDTHCGSHYGLWPDADLPGRGFSGVRYTNRCFAHCVETVKASLGTIDLLILAGDLIDGPNRKSDSTGLFTASLGEQVEGAIDVLRPLVEMSNRVIRLDGTPYHEGFHRALGALDREFGVSRTTQVVDINLDGGVLNAAHHPTGGGVLYRGTQLDREAIWASIAATRRKVPMARWIYRAHQHDYLYLETQDAAVCSLPCWELPTPHAKKVAYWRFQPTLGACALVRDEQHDFGYSNRRFLYDPPMPGVTDYGDLREKRPA